jgi:hypothetical protein
MAHINVIDASSVMREDFMRHGFHLNSQGKKRLKQLVAERVVDGRVSSTSSIPVITHATASSFLNSKAHTYSTYIKCVSSVSEAHKQNTEPSNLVTIFHQNIRGLRNKSDELIPSFVIDTINPHILCLSEYYIAEQNLLHLSLNGYHLGSSFCEKDFRMEVCVFMLRTVNISKLIHYVTARSSNWKFV